MKQILSLLFGSLFFTSIYSQIGGDNSYEFLNLNTAARVSALGGNQIAVRDNDPFLAYNNPSLLNEKMDNKLALTYQSYLADIGVGFVSYTKNVDSIGVFSAGVQYVDYGSFTETDNAGNEIGGFSAGEYAFFVGYGRMLDSNFSAGVNTKVIYSSFYDFQSTGLALDLGLNYVSDHERFTMALVIKNVGSQLTTYGESDNQPLPFEIQYGITNRFEKVPLRLGLMLHNLQQWDLTYENPNDDDNASLFGENDQNEKNENGFLEKLGRHMIVNAEFLISENFNFRLGYNYFRRAELKIDEKLGSVGISWGFGMRISKFHFSYGRSAYHQAGATNTFSVSTRLSDFVN